MPSPTITISLMTLAECVFAGLFIASVIAVSTGIVSIPGGLAPAGGGSQRIGRKSKPKRKSKNGVPSDTLEPSTIESPTRPIQQAQNGNLHPPTPLQVSASKGQSKPNKPTSRSVKVEKSQVITETSAASSATSKSQREVPVSTEPTQPNEKELSYAVAASTGRNPSHSKSAKKLLSQNLSVSAVADMRDLEVDPERETARVMKIVKPSGLAPVDTENGWEESPAGDDGGWEVAKSKKTAGKSGAKPSSAFALSNPSPASHLVPGLTSSAQAEMTKKQRENAKKTAKVALEKQAAEEERLALLSAHRRQLERTRMLEQEKERNKGKTKQGPKSVNVVKAKEQSGGMRATFDDGGKLVWE